MLVGLETRSLQSLIPYAQNTRTHSEEQVEQIAASIREFGWTNPVLIDEGGNIIAGHGRVRAAERLLSTEVPCLVLTGLSAVQKRAYAIADNKIALNAGWDEKLLALELLDLKAAGYELEMTFFAGVELKGLIGEDAPTRTGKTADDTSPDPPPDNGGSAGRLVGPRPPPPDGRRFNGAGRRSAPAQRTRGAPGVDRPALQRGVRSGCRQDHER